MTQIFKSDGQVVPATIIEAGPCLVTQVKTLAKDKYASVQLGYGLKNKINKPLTGHLKNLPKLRFLKEFITDSNDKLTSGQQITVAVFKAGDKVKATGVSKGKGFQGVVKRHGFGGSPATHGHKDQLRMPGSVGSTDPARVFKGLRMAGRTGGDRITIANLEIVQVDPEKNYLYIKGAVPGARNGLIMIYGQGEITEIVSAPAMAAEKNNEVASEPSAQEESKATDKQ